MIFKRRLYDDILKWKQQFGGSMALIIKGARRVGKSTLAETFAKNEYRSYILIDFANCKQEVKEYYRLGLRVHALADDIWRYA